MRPKKEVFEELKKLYDDDTLDTTDVELAVLEALVDIRDLLAKGVDKKE